MTYSDPNVTSDMTTTEQGDPNGDFDNYLWMYFSPPLFLFGVIGNAITFLVMRRKSFRNTSTGVYMTLIAVMDTSFLIIGLFLDWLEWCGFLTFKNLHEWTCRVYRLMFYGTGDAAIWLIVAFSFDRFVAVCFPLHKTTVCIKRRAYIAFSAILLLAFCKNLHVFWTRGLVPEEDQCKSLAPYRHFESYVRPWIAFSLAMAAPFFLILSFNCLMIRSLIQAQRRRSSGLIICPQAGNKSPGTAAPGAASQGVAPPGTAGRCQLVLTPANRNQNTKNTYRQTSFMCISVSIAFLICIAPSIVLLVGKPYWARTPNLWYDYAKVINNLLVYVNHSINFVLYCLSGQRFRAEMMAMFRGRRSGAPSSSTPTTPSANGPSLDRFDYSTGATGSQQKEGSITPVPPGGSRG